MAASRPSSSGSQKRNYLSLERKVEVIKHLQKNPGTSIRALGEMFGCGKTKFSNLQDLLSSSKHHLNSTAFGPRYNFKVHYRRYY